MNPLVGMPDEGVASVNEVEIRVHRSSKPD